MRSPPADAATTLVDEYGEEVAKAMGTQAATSTPGSELADSTTVAITFSATRKASELTSKQTEELAQAVDIFIGGGFVGN